MKVLITGANGFIGSHLVEHLRQKTEFHIGKQVRKVTDDLNKFTIETISDRDGSLLGRYYSNNDTHIYLGDLSHYDGIKNCIDHYQPDVVVHLAAQANPMNDDPNAMLNDNVQTTHNLVRACSELQPHFIFASSILLYGDHRRCDEYAMCEPTSMYGITKLTCEHLINFYLKKATHLRMCATIGSKNLTHGVVHDFIRKLKSDEKNLEIIGDRPGSSKPYLHVNDVCHIIELFIHYQHTGIYNICPFEDDDSHMLSIDKLADIVMSELEIKKPKKWLGESHNYKGDNRLLSARNVLIKNFFKVMFKKSWYEIMECPTSEEALRKALREM